MDIDTFLRELSRLERELSRGNDNLASFECKQCDSCTSCMFCTDCRFCHGCTHCERCDSATGCSHCADCERCHKCAYCRNCQRCLGSSYLVRCTDCVDCTYCYGCVGLIKKEFHILNVRYPRKQYFELTAELDESLTRLGKRLRGTPSSSRLPAVTPAPGLVTGRDPSGDPSDEGGSGHSPY